MQIRGIIMPRGSAENSSALLRYADLRSGRICLNPLFSRKVRCFRMLPFVLSHTASSPLIAGKKWNQDRFARVRKLEDSPILELNHSVSVGALFSTRTFCGLALCISIVYFEIVVAISTARKRLTNRLRRDDVTGLADRAHALFAHGAVQRQNRCAD